MSEKRKLPDYFQSRYSKKNCTGVNDIIGGKLKDIDFISSNSVSYGEVHYKFILNEFNDEVYCGYSENYYNISENSPYIKILADHCETFDGKQITSIKGNVGIAYEVIYDMINRRMYIKETNGVPVEICTIDSLGAIFLFVTVGKNSEVEFIDHWKLPLIVNRKKIHNKRIDNNIFSFKTRTEQLYNNDSDNVCDKIEYVVCNEVFKDIGNHNFDFILNTEMKKNDGLYHFYYQLISDGQSISFGYFDTEIQLTKIQGKVGEIYEVIYDMINMKMWIKKENGTIRETAEAIHLPTPPIQLPVILIKPIYPCVSIGNAKGLVKLIEYYKERENYMSYKDIAVYKNTRIYEIDDYREYDRIYLANVIDVPNTIYGIYNYEKYYWMYELSLIKANAPNTDLKTIKEIIQRRFVLNVKQKEYVDSSDIFDLIVFMNCYADEISDSLDLPDSFIRVVNNMSIIELDRLDKEGKVVQPIEKKKYLHFISAKNDVFQFPTNNIYIRKGYYTMYRDIAKLFKKYTNVIITGHPGIGKTSFIYVILFFIKNLYKMEALTKEIYGIRNNLNDLGLANVCELNPDDKINEITEEITRIVEEIRDEYKRLKYIKRIISSKAETLPHRSECLHYIDYIVNGMIRVNNYYNFRIDEIEDDNELKYNDSLYNDINPSLDIVHQFYLRLEEEIKKIDNLTLIKRLFFLLKEKIDELNIIKDYTKIDNFLDDSWRRKDGKLKDIYIVKGKRWGNSSDKKIYLFRDGFIFKINIPLEDINDSIIIVDTLNEEFGRNNKIISISSPENKNYDRYETTSIKYKEMYFDSLDDIEIREWFKYCTGFNVSVEDNNFKEICERYGYIPRQIYYHYLYKENYENRNYWKYYNQLIDGVIGTIGYQKFKNAYQHRDSLKGYPLSNIILKYQFQSKWSNELGHFILKPEEELIYISNSVKNYIQCKFYPPKDNEEYGLLKNTYKSFTDIYVKRMSLKQVIAYELSINKINFRIVKTDNRRHDEYVSNPKFKLNTNKDVSFCNNNNTLNLVYFILDDNNFFDLIMDGVFIKVLDDDEKLDNNERFNKDNVPHNIKERMEQSIKEYSKNDDFVYCVIIYQTPPKIIYNTEMTFQPLPQPLSVPVTPSLLLLLPPPLAPISSTTTEENYVFVGDKTYLMRKCYKDMLKIICKDDFNFPYQRNYLIFGNSKIGKTVLGDILKDKLEKKLSGNIQVFTDYGSEQHESKKIKYDKNKPYVVIVRGKAVGEDDYADAKMVIMLANPSDEKCKTFQSKRCPLVMYIPPFTKKEIEEVVTMLGISKDLEAVDIQSNIQLYLDKYELYGGVIGNYGINESILELCVDSNLMKEKMKGISKSSLSKCEYEKLLIYETDENDVTKSDNLRFLSDTIREIVYKVLFKDVRGCKNMIDMFDEYPTGSGAGELYERIIFYLMKNSTDFRNDIVKKMKDLMWEIFKDDEDSNVLKEFLKKKVYVSNEKSEVKSEADLKKRITQFCNNDDEMAFIPLNYCHDFPDIDALVGPFGIQITIRKQHKFAPEMAMILQNLYRMYTEGYNEQAKNYITTVDEKFKFGYFFISNQNNVYYEKVFDRVTEYYPSFFQELTQDLEDDEKEVLYELAKKQKRTILVESKTLYLYCMKLIEQTK